MFKILQLILLISFSFPHAIVSDDSVDRLSYSISIFRDNEDYYLLNNLVDPNDDELINYNAYLGKADFSLLLDGAYEISFIYAYNKSGAKAGNDKTFSLNAYALPLDGKYGFLKFNYHFKEKEKFPLNLFFGIQYGKNFENSYNLSSSNAYQSYEFNLGLYKEFDAGNYPIIPYVELVSNKAKINNSFLYLLNNKDSYFKVNLGCIIKLSVPNVNNSPHLDLIWLNPTISINNNDIFAGFNIGLSHPLK